MKNIQLNIILVFLILGLSSCNKTPTKNYIQYVNQLIGTAYAPPGTRANRGRNYIESGQTIPAVSSPFGMTQWTIQSQSSEKAGIPPFYSGRIRFQGIRATHWLNGSCSNDYGSFTVFPTNLKNSYRLLPGQRETMFMYNSEINSPAYLAILMPELNIMSEITSTKRSAIMKFSWVTPEIPTIIIDINSDQRKGFIKVDVEKGEVYGYNPAYKSNKNDDTPTGLVGYFVAKFDTKIINSGTYSGMNFESGTNERKNQKNIGAYVSFELTDNSPVKMKIGTSFTSIENARKNLNAEIPDWDFNTIKKDLENTWNNILGSFEVESNSNEELTKFYTALYRTLLQPRLYSDVNGEYPGFDNDSTIHVANDFNYYGDFATWNSYRTQMPLLALIAPHEYNDMIKSLIAKAGQSDWLPVASEMNAFSTDATGDFSSTIIADACMKNFDFNYKKAYKYLRKNAFESPDIIDYNNGKGRRSLNSYLELGYIPLEDENMNGGQVTRTLEYAYNDWCIAQVAKKLGEKTDYEELMGRSLNYMNIFDAEKNMVCGKFADDTFTDEFDTDKLMPYLTEGTPGQYSFFAPHDINGLIELAGGKDKFREKLQNIFDDKNIWPGNEPGQFIPFLFNSTGNWEKTQTTVKEILTANYGIETDGLSRNDLAGQMSAWYVFSSVGFYPACPASNTYQLSAPIFRKVTLHLDKDFYPGGKIVFKTNPRSNTNPFTKVEWNGKEIKPKITFEDICKGGELLFSGEQ
jgi:predicted alpha-1,2-mannosidase